MCSSMHSALLHGCSTADAASLEGDGCVVGAAAAAAAWCVVSVSVDRHKRWGGREGVSDGGWWRGRARNVRTRGRTRAEPAEPPRNRAPPRFTPRAPHAAAQVAQQRQGAAAPESHATAPREWRGGSRARRGGVRVTHETPCTPHFRARPRIVYAPIPHTQNLEHTMVPKKHRAESADRAVKLRGGETRGAAQSNAVPTTARAVPPLPQPRAP